MKLLRRCLLALSAGAVALGVLPAPATADPPSLPPLDVSKFFDDAAIPLGGTTTLNIDLTNTTDFDFEDVGFSDQLPDGLAVLAETTTTMCGGQLDVINNTITVLGVDLPAGESCSTFATVTALEVGVFQNTAFTIDGRDTAFATLIVVAPPTVAKSFNPAVVRSEGTTTLTVTLTNPNTTTTLTEVGADDVLPSGMLFANPANATNTCGANVDLTPGIRDLLQMSGGSLAPGASCTVSVDVTVRGAGSITNNAAAFSLESGDPEGHPGRLGLGSGSVYVLVPPRLTKQFGATTIGLNGSTSLTFTLTNPNPSTALTDITFDDRLPDGLLFDDTDPTGACGGTFEAHTNALIMIDGTLAGGATCSFAVDVTGTTLGNKLNTTSQVSSAETQVGDPATASVLVADPPSIAKSFGAATMPLNGTTRMTLTISNPNPFALEGVAVVDNLPAGTSVANPSNLANGCGGLAVAAAGTNLVSLSGGSVTGASCQIGVDVTAFVAGVRTNTTGNVSATNAGTGNFDTASITVIAPPVISKTFGALQIPVGGTTSLRFTITNPNPSDALTGVGFTDTLPLGLVVAPAFWAATCGGSVSAPAGSDTISLSNGTIAANSICSVQVDVQGVAAGPQVNTVAATSNEGGQGATSGPATITVVGPPVLSKSFASSVIPVGSSTTLTFRVENPNPLHHLTQVGFTDSLPSGLVVASPNGLSGSCGGGTISAVAGSGTISLADAHIVPAASCSFSVNVRGTSAGVKDNTTGAVGSLEGGTGTTANASLVVASPPVLSKEFDDSSIPLGGSTFLTFTLSNPNSDAALSGVGFTDSFPAGLVAPMTGTASICGGTATAATGSLTLTGATLAPGGQCSFSLPVQGTTAGPKNNVTGAVGATEGGSGTTASASLVVVAPPSIVKGFAPGLVPVNGTSSLTFTVQNPNLATTLTGVAFSDSLPAGVVVNTPNGLSNSCGGSASAAAGTVSLTGGSIPPLASCTVTVAVKGVGAGTKNNVSGNVTSANGGTGNTASATLVVAVPPSIAKVFGVSSLRKGNTTTLTFTVSNPNAGTPLTGVIFTDVLPFGLVVGSPAGVVNGCGGIVQALAGSNALSLSGVTLPASGSCTLRVNVRASGSTGVKNNTTTPVTSNEVGLGNRATATITITN
jgi:uncharacterized repeat protein (TIGR01451 family)